MTPVRIRDAAPSPDGNVIEVMLGAAEGSGGVRRAVLAAAAAQRRMWPPRTPYSEPEPLVKFSSASSCCFNSRPRS